jgi:hypothetical protein
MEQTLTTFNFHLDTKITTWMRTEFEIEANSLEEAKLKAIEFHDKSNTSSIGWDEVMDTQEPMTPDENGGEPTEELFDEDGNCIWNNTKSN